MAPTRPPAVLSEPRFRASRLAEAVLAGAAFPLLVLHAGMFAATLEGEDAFRAVLGAVAGLLLLDGLTGLVHWMCDTWGDENTRAVGPGLIRSFREHHTNPRAMLSHDWLHVNRETLIATTIAMTIFAAPTARDALADRPFLAGLVYATFGLGCIANQLHYWAHSERAPRIVRRLQSWRLLLSPETHARHHRSPHTSGYCIATGWLNPVLDRSGAWRILERGITLVLGAQPRTRRPRA